jgi:hypothetical protein
MVSDPQQQQPPPTTPPPTASPAAASPGELSIPRFFSDKWYCGHDLLRELKSGYSSALNSSIGLVKIFHLLRYLHPTRHVAVLPTRLQMVFVYSQIDTVGSQISHALDRYAMYTKRWLN